MWIERPAKKASFIKALQSLNSQVLILMGARQVGKTSFILNVLEGMNSYPQLKLNLLYPSSFKLNGVQYLGRDFFGTSETGEVFLKNIELEFGKLHEFKKPMLIFIDEVDRYPLALEAIQTIAEFSDKLKFVFTGSNLENIPVKNAATGRKKYFDLHPITFREFISAGDNEKLLHYLDSVTLKDIVHSEFYHKQLCRSLDIYIRIGGLPRIVSAYLEGKSGEIPELVKDMAVTIEENVKTVLGEKAKLYEYEDILRKIVHLSMNTLKYSHLQVQHAGRSEAKKIIAKTVGARVVHKIRLFESEMDISKYILFDCGIANYLLNGSDLLKTSMNDKNMAILYETFAGIELITSMTTRDDLFYWKSENKAEVEFLIKSPFAGIDVKTSKGNIRSLNSLALLEPQVSQIVKVYNGPAQINYDHLASLPNFDRQRKVTLISIPHYLICRLFELIK